MELYFGIIIGLIIATLFFIVVAFFRSGIDKKVDIIEQVLERKEKGYIFEPEDEQDIIRKEKIEENNKLGLDTPFDELR